METLSRFDAKSTSLIVAVLSCFDRVIFKGHLPIADGPALEGFVDHVLEIRRCDFMAFAERQSAALFDRARRLAEEAEHTRARLVAGRYTPGHPQAEPEPTRVCAGQPPFILPERRPTPPPVLQERFHLPRLSLCEPGGHTMTSGLKLSNPGGALHKQISLAVLARERQLLRRTDEGEAMEHVIAETSSGRVRGIVNDGISVFKGMPYGGRADDDAIRAAIETRIVGRRARCVRIRAARDTER